MKKILSFSFVFLSAIYLHAQVSEEPYKSRIDSLLLDPMFETSHVGLMVYDLTADTTLYVHDHRQLLRPASTMKLLTAVTALRELGTDYRFHTDFRIEGTVCDSVFRGDIYCIGGFDPAFGDDEMTVLVDSIRSLGIHTLSGNIIADRSMKDSVLLGEGWSWDDPNPVLSPLLYNRKDCFVDELCRRLAADSISLQVTTLEGEAPAPRWGTVHTIDQILLRMMKQSDNLYAEALLYQVAAASGSRPSTVQQAQEAERRLIKDLGLRPDDYRLSDGSGLSPYNYLSAELLVKLLCYVYHNERIYRHLFPVLPCAGYDGTLKDRMKTDPTRGNVWAKTGTLTGVSSLAGYAQAANGHMLAFAVINTGVRSTRTARNFQDHFCEALCLP